MNKRQCNKCGFERISKSRRHTYAEIKSYIEGENGNNCTLITTKDEFEKLILNEIPIHIKLKIRCSCGKVYSVCFYNFKSSQQNKCKICSKEEKIKKLSISNETFANRFNNKVGKEYSLLSKYINNKTKIKVKHICNNCNNYEFEVFPNDFIKNPHCDKCNNTIKNKTNKEFLQEVYDLVGNEYTIISPYIRNDNKVLMKHNMCNNKYFVSPNKFLQGRRCPICNESKGEQIIRHYYENKNTPFVTQYEFNGLVGLGGGNLKFDFAIFNDREKTDLKYLIEYDGEFHYLPVINDKQLKIQQIHDKRKDKYCKENNIKLIRIPYWKFDNIRRILDYIDIEQITDMEYYKGRPNAVGVFLKKSDKIYKLS